MILFLAPSMKRRSRKNKIKHHLALKYQEEGEEGSINYK